MKKFKKKVLYLISFLIFISILTTTYFIWPKNIVTFVWLENIYILTFFLAIIWGVFFLTASSFYASFVTFILGWADLLTLSLISAFWLTIWDSVFYYIGKKSRLIWNESIYKDKIKKFTKWLNNYSYKKVFLFIFFYWGFSPFPKDIVSLWFWISNYWLKKIIIAIFCGNIMFTLLIWNLAIFWLME